MCKLLNNVAKVECGTMDFVLFRLMIRKRVIKIKGTLSCSIKDKRLSQAKPVNEVLLRLILRVTRLSVSIKVTVDEAHRIGQCINVIQETGTALDVRG